MNFLAEQIIFPVILGIALSIDAFMLGMVYGLSFERKRPTLFLALLVGLFHFTFPLIGFILASTIISNTSLDTKLVTVILLSFLSLQLFFNNNTKQKQLKISMISYISFAFAVSLDSFLAGISLISFTYTNILLSAFIFSLISFTATFSSLNIGVEIRRIFNKIPLNKVAAIILIFLSIAILLNAL